MLDDTTNSEGTVDDGNLDESGASVIEQPAEPALADAQPEDPTANLQTLDDWMASAPEHLREELEGGFLRGRDYTQKTQSVAEERRRLEAEDQARLAALPQQQEPPQAEPAKSWTPDDIRANPVGYMDHRVEERASAIVEERLAALGLNDVKPALDKIRWEGSIRSAFQNYLSADPARAAIRGLGDSIAEVIGSDPSLRALADSNPDAAVAAAGSVAMARRAEQQAASKLAQMRKTAVAKREAAPLSTQAGAPTPPRSSQTDIEVANAALAEAFGTN